MDEFEAGRQDALSNEVNFDWTDVWTDGYRRGVIAGMAEIA